MVHYTDRREEGKEEGGERITRRGHKGGKRENIVKKGLMWFTKRAVDKWNRHIGHWMHAYQYNG